MTAIPRSADAQALVFVPALDRDHASAPAQHVVDVPASQLLPMLARPAYVTAADLEPAALPAPLDVREKPSSLAQLRHAMLALLLAEEHHQRRDAMQCWLFNQVLETAPSEGTGRRMCGRHFLTAAALVVRAEVPGVKENRPLLACGDVVLIRPAVRHVLSVCISHCPAPAHRLPCAGGRRAAHDGRGAVASAGGVRAVPARPVPCLARV